MSEIRLGQRRVKLPKGRFWRVCLGVILLLGGIVGFLPVVGFWMAPLGIMVLSIDFPAVRKFKRRVKVRYGRWVQARRNQSRDRS
jgi:hypothetical protein